MKITKKLEKKVIRVTFLDHAMGSKIPVPCTVVGEVSKVEKLHILLCFWRVPEDMGDHNNEYLSIISSTILSLKVLK